MNNFMSTDNIFKSPPDESARPLPFFDSLAHIDVNGEIVLHEDLLNKVWRPVILEQVSENIDDLRLSVRNGLLQIDTAGQVRRVPFLARHSLKVIKFEFNPRAHRIVLGITEDISGLGDFLSRLMVGTVKAIINQLLGKNFAVGWLTNQPGIEVDGNRIYANLEQMPWYRDFSGIQVLGISLASLMEIDLVQIDDGKLVFKVNLVKTLE